MNNEKAAESQKRRLCATRSIQHRVSARCPRCEAGTWWKTHPQILEKRRIKGHIHYKLQCQKCGHEWWWHKPPELPQFRGYQIILGLCGIPWKARGLLAVKRELIFSQFVDNKLNTTTDRKHDVERMILAEAKKRAQKIQRQYGISDGQLFLLWQALAEFDSLMNASRVGKGVPDEALRQYCQVAIDRAWKKHRVV